MSRSAMWKALAIVVLTVGLAAVLGGAWWLNKGQSVSVPPAAAPTLESVPGAAPDAPANTGVRHDFKLYPKVAVLADTLALGYIGGGPSWAEALANDMCWSIAAKSAELETGYTNPGGSPDTSAFTDRADEVAASGPAVILVQGGLHDYRARPERLRDAAFKTFTTLKDQSAPGTMIVAVGPLAAGDIATPEDVAKISGAISAAAADAGVIWIDPMAEQWLPDPSFFSQGGIMPNAKGQLEYAKRFAADLRALNAPSGC